MGTVGRYTIYGKIASGGMASVHFARVRGGEGFAPTVAVKRLHPHLAEDPDFRATLIDEARMAARIHHPNVVPTLDVFSEEGEVLVVMEYVRGESLARLLRPSVGRKPMPLSIASAIAVGALSGLHAAHEAKSDRGVPLGIVHRDVSPQNILVGADGLARVIDFGVAKAAGRLQITRDGAIKGKRAYMAPEQIGGGSVTPLADVYAMGVLLWEMLAAKRLFSGESEPALIASVLAGAQEPPSRHAPELPPALDALVMKALALEPIARFASAEEMAEALVGIVPPALSIEVGRWVEESAGAALADRTTQLAEIEGSGGGETPLAGEVVTAILVPEPSSLSVETRPSAIARARPRRMTWSNGLAAGAIVALGLTTMAWRGATTRGSAPSGAATDVVAAATPPPVSLVEASDRPAPASATPASSFPETAPSRPPLRPPASASGPKSSGSTPPPASPHCVIATDYDAEGQPHFRRLCK
jgi:eukaryotic-like serine/threonine-protein kinase